MFRFPPSRLYTTFWQQRFSTKKQPDNSRKLSHGVGQDLSNRYLRLEKSLRGKEALSKELDEYSHSSSMIPVAVRSKKSSPIRVQEFRGFRIPEEPKTPADDECCMSGCAVCVYDLYEETLEAYKEAVKSLRKSLSALDIPEDEWPSSIRQQSSGGPSTPDKRKEVVLNAFEEMEKALKLKRQSEAEGRNRIKAKRNQLVPKKETYSLGQAFARLYEALRWMFINP